MTDTWLATQRKVEALLPKVLLEETEHWRKEPGYKSYRVLLEGKDIGRVEHGDETIERGPKGARYVTRRWTRKRWRYRHPDLNSTRLYYDSRKRAVAELIEHLILHGKLLDAP